jgi:hypothetical protein
MAKDDDGAFGVNAFTSAISARVFQILEPTRQSLKGHAVRSQESSGPTLSVSGQGEPALSLAR